VSVPDAAIPRSTMSSCWKIPRAPVTDGLTASLNRRMLTAWELYVAEYTLSKTVDDASDFDEQPQSPFDLGADTLFQASISSSALP